MNKYATDGHPVRWTGLYRPLCFSKIFNDVFIFIICALQPKLIYHLHIERNIENYYSDESKIAILVL